MKAYWSDSGWRNGNAGDFFNRDLLPWISGREVVRVNTPNEADIIGLGSIAEHLNGEQTGYVWGTGMISEHTRKHTPHAKVCAVRGHLTRKRWRDADLAALGDPGLLIAQCYGISKKENPRFLLGVIPHYVDEHDEMVKWWAMKWTERVTVLDVCAHPRDLANAMSDCRVILSSSLHGLVFADAMGIPNQWIALGDRLAGGSFKFRDYYSVFDIQDPLACPFGLESNALEIAASVLREYQRDGIEKIQRELIASFPCV